MTYLILAGRPVPWTGLLKCKIEMPYIPCPSPPGGGGGRAGGEVGGGGRVDSRLQGSVIFEHLLTLSEVFYPAFTFPARGRLEGGGGMVDCNSCP